MIYRHHIAPPRAFTQFSHGLIRHPRLSSDAVRLLTWQLSLPEGARESLSRTAERAGIGATAFTRAKRQLKDEGFVHERRLQGPGGHWVTQQLVSNVPLNPAEAAKLLARMPVQASPAPVSPQVAPSPRIPAVGAPTPPPADGHPRKDPGGNTSHRPAERDTPAPEAAEPPDVPGPAEAARALVSSYRDLDPVLCTVPRSMHAELTDLTARWLAAGHAPAAVPHPHPAQPPRRRHPGPPPRRPPALPAPRRPTRVRTGQRVHPSGPEPRPPPPTAEQPRPDRLSARLTALRECEGDHVQATLFRPAGDETLCRGCRDSPSPVRNPVSRPRP
ncbi:hypothetical protein ACF09K_01770 [Streptomyces sp. NPDC014882]|uniref:hypothetical protein n=1 Tax=Streptomyces sp. NPDC014882 TaxID=3364927 RepID=UPI0036F7166D